MKRNLPQSSTNRQSSLTPQASKKVFRHSDGTFRPADRIERMSDNDWDIVNSYRTHRERVNDFIDDAACNDDEPSKTFVVHTLTRKGPITLIATFQINHAEDNARVIISSTNSYDNTKDYSVNEARKVYATLLRRGFARTNNS